MKPIISALLISAAALLLVACGEDEQSFDTSSWQKAELYYSYPMNEQQEVAPNAPLVLSFLGEIEVENSTFSLKDEQGNQVGFDLKLVNHNTGVVITPHHPLKTLTQYVLTASEIQSAKGGAKLPENGLRFTTRPALDGSLEGRFSAVQFEVKSVSPDGVELPFVDFSSVNIRLTQPVNETTVVYGKSIKLVQDDEVVPANLLVKGRYITLDPISDEGFDTDSAITLVLNGDIKNKQGGALPTFRKTINAEDSHPRITMVQEAPAASDRGGCEDDSAALSPLTGDAINCVPVIAKLLGNNTTSKQQGNMYAELAFAPRFPDATPLRIKKGALLKGDALSVMIGGEVPAGFDSGEVTVTFLADANGYLLDNPYSTADDAPKRLLLNLDLAFDTIDSRANGAFTQDLLQVTLVGAAIADPETGSLVIDALGVVEPKVLGLEEGYGVLSFHMESYPDQDNLPVVAQQPGDERILEVSAWQPGQYARSQQADDPIVINFNKPLDKTTIKGGDTLLPDEESVLLKHNGNLVKFEWYLDGTSLVLRPKQGLQYSQTEQEANYTVTLKESLQDLAGNPLRAQTLAFNMPVFVEEAQQSPVVLTAYPGFPCVTSNTDLERKSAGQCIGAAASDDDIPLARMPSNRSIYVTFSQNLDQNSVNNSTFVVEQVDMDGEALGKVAGKLDVNGYSVRFTPTTSWQQGAYYRYRLKSQLNDANCGEDAICDTRGLPVQTQVLVQNIADSIAPTAGGPNMDVYFQAVHDSNNVLQHLRNAPTADVNANFFSENAEVKVSERADAIKNSVKIVRDPLSNGKAAKGGGLGALLLTLDANVGCGFSGSSRLGCDDEKHSFITGNLDVDIVGFKTPAEVAALAAQEEEQWGHSTIPERVLQQGAVLAYLYPTQLVLSSATIYVYMGINTISPPTGPQFMRIRYTCVAEDCAAPDYGRVKGWIVKKEDGSGAEFVTELNLYLDAPNLDPEAVGIKLKHNLHSYPLNLQLAGDLKFLADGRLQIEQVSQNELPLKVKTNAAGEVVTVSLYVKIPEGGTVLNYVSEPIKP